MNKLASLETLTGTTPTIESDRTLAVVSFPLKSAIQRMTEASPVAENGADVAKNVGNVGKDVANVGKNVGCGAENVPVNENVAKNVAKKLTERQQQIIALIKENPDTTRADIAAKIGVATKTIEREIATISDTVRYVGSKKGGHWEIIEN